MSVEDIVGPLRGEETLTDPTDGSKTQKVIMNFDMIIDRMIDVMLAREKYGRNYGVIVVAEGLAEYLPSAALQGIKRDDHGHISISDINLNRVFAKAMSEAYHKRTGKTRKVNGMQLGYESRCAPPTAFDVMLGSQIGVGAFRALVEQKLNGVMISVGGQFEVTFVPFSDLVDPNTLVTKVRYIEKDSDFYRMARLLETQV
jgi:6-phosphofructokinase 1